MSFETPDGSFLSETSGIPATVIVPSSGDTYKMKAADRVLFVNNAAVLATLTIWLPKGIRRSELVEIGFANTVTTLTVLDGFGAAIAGAPTKPAVQNAIVMRWISRSIGWVTWKFPKGIVNQTSPTNPTGTTSATAVMMGLAGAYTPRSSGRVLMVLSGDIKQSTSGDGATIALRYGTGTAPVNGAAVTGTLPAGTAAQTFVAAANNQTVPFSIQALIGALTNGTAYWFDAALLAVTGGTASIENLSLSIYEP